MGEGIGNLEGVLRPSSYRSRHTAFTLETKKTTEWSSVQDDLRCEDSTSGAYRKKKQERERNVGDGLLLRGETPNYHRRWWA